MRPAGQTLIEIQSDSYKYLLIIIIIIIIIASAAHIRRLHIQFDLLLGSILLMIILDVVSDFSFSFHPYMAYWTVFGMLGFEMTRHISALLDNCKAYGA